MRTKVTLVLLLLNVVLFFFIFHFERNWRTERIALEERRRVLGAEAADIRVLEVASALPGQSFRLEKRDNAWFLTKPVEWPANPDAVSRMISALQFLEHETSFSVRDVLNNGQSLADYGLAHPRLTVTLDSGGRDTTGSGPTETVLRIGDAIKTGERLYLLSSDGTRIHVVGRELADSLSLPLAKLRADTVLTIPVFEARSLNLQVAPPAGVRILIQREGSRWWFETPIPARGGKDAIELALNGLNSLQVKRFVTDAPPVPAPRDEPVLTATVGGDNRHETLFLGPPVPGAPPAADGGQETYAQREGFPPVFVVDVPPKLLETLRNAQESLRDNHVLDFDPAAVSVITLSAPNQPELILHRLEPGADSGWRIVLRGENGQGPATPPADRAEVQRLLDALAGLTAEQFTSDAPQESDLENWGLKLPERIVTLSLTPSAPDRGSAQTEISLEIGRGGQRDRYVYARLAQPASQSVYAVLPDILKETPISPSAWRDRTLAALPAAARITALKLTEAAGGRVILEWAAGQPRSPAVDALLGPLRVLRAVKFSSGGFTPTARVDGEEEPWKYRLDATIALPAGSGGERTSVRTLWLAERGGGNEQWAGSSEFGADFTIEPAFLDALWKVTYGARDPGVPAPRSKEPPRP